MMRMRTITMATPAKVEEVAVVTKEVEEEASKTFPLHTLPSKKVEQKEKAMTPVV
jgi:hypothetical protein